MLYMLEIRLALSDDEDEANNRANHFVDLIRAALNDDEDITEAEVVKAERLV